MSLAEEIYMYCCKSREARERRGPVQHGGLGVIDWEVKENYRIVAEWVEEKLGDFQNLNLRRGELVAKEIYDHLCIEKRGKSDSFEDLGLSAKEHYRSIARFLVNKIKKSTTERR